MSDVVEELVRRNRAYAATFVPGEQPRIPARGLAVVACMDARLDVYAALGLEVGDAHVIRNAGAAVTDDVIRSLAVSQRLLNTRDVVLVGHTDCGMAAFSDDSLKDAIEAEAGVRPPFSFETFEDPEEAIRRGIRSVRSSPFLPHRDPVRGFVYDVATGLLREVTA